jgi:DNA-binding LacI/PurR family transcriptional regulator
MRTQRALTGKFDEALRDGRATVWVAFNDTVACAALEHLEAQGVGVPGSVSVVGFDNGQAAVARNLTSYEFGSAMYANAMLNYVLNPSGGPFRSRRNAVVFDGYLVERGSSRAVSRQT